MSYLDIWALGAIVSVIAYGFTFFQAPVKFHTLQIFIAGILLFGATSWIGFAMLLGAINADRKKNKEKEEVDGLEDLIASHEALIGELEQKLSIVLDIATDGHISKPYTNIETIREAMHNKTVREWEEAVIDYKECYEKDKR